MKSVLLTLAILATPIQAQEELADCQEAVTQILDQAVESGFIPVNQKQFPVGFLIQLVHPESMAVLEVYLFQDGKAEEGVWREEYTVEKLFKCELAGEGVFDVFTATKFIEEESQPDSRRAGQP